MSLQGICQTPENCPKFKYRNSQTTKAIFLEQLSELPSMSHNLSHTETYSLSNSRGRLPEAVGCHKNVEEGVTFHFQPKLSEHFSKH